mmetsp:Transcript_95803/g.276714  ORF Transcript_95803/g.276714 Transcript_95803/m.276714 type:complete len:204 (-) Transcript_95803:58-669(-)
MSIGAPAFVVGVRCTPVLRDCTAVLQVVADCIFRRLLALLALGNVRAPSAPDEVTTPVSVAATSESGAGGNLGLEAVLQNSRSIRSNSAEVFMGRISTHPRTSTEYFRVGLPSYINTVCGIRTPSSATSDPGDPPAALLANIRMPVAVECLGLDDRDGAEADAPSGPTPPASAPTSRCSPGGARYTSATTARSHLKSRVESSA